MLLFQILKNTLRQNRDAIQADCFSIDFYTQVAITKKKE